MTCTMAASLCLLLFATLFPGVLGAVLGQDLHIYVGIGETAEFPLRNFPNFTDSEMLYLIRVTPHPKIIEQLLNLTAGAPVQNVKINETWQGRLSLLERPDDIVAKLRNVQPKDTGREVYYRYIQNDNRQGPRMYIIFKTPPPVVSSFSIINAGEDYANITWKQVEPFDSAPVWYHLEYREAGVVSLSDSWEQTNRVPHDHNPNVTTQMIKVEGLSPGTKYQFRVVASNRFGESYSYIEEAGTMEPQKSVAPPPVVSSFSIINAGEDYVNITLEQVKPYDSAPVWYHLEYREAGVVSSSDSWNQTDRVSHSANVTTQQIKVEGLIPGAKYQFRVVSSNRFGESYSHIEEAGTKEAQRGPPFHSGYVALIIIAILILPAVACTLWYYLVYRKDKTKKKQRNPQANSENIELQDPRSEETDPLLDDQHVTTDGVPSGGQPPAAPAGGQPPAAPAGGQPPAAPAGGQPPAAPAGGQPPGAPAGGQPQAAPAGEQPPAAPAGGQPPGAPAGGQTPGAPAGQPPAAPAGEQPPAVGGQPPAATGQTDDSILEPLLHYTGTGRGSEVEEGPDWGNGSAHELQPLLNGDNSTETDAVPSSGLEKPFEHRVALYYDDNRENKKKVVEIRGMLEKWGFSVYDLHRDGEGRKMRDYSYSVEKCQHGIFCLPIKTKMDVFQFDVFLANTLQGQDRVPTKRSKILISFHDRDLENTVDTVKTYLADAEALPYKEEKTFDWRKLYRKLAIPGCPLTVEEVKGLVGAESDTVTVEDLAGKLKIPQEVVSGNGGVTEQYKVDMLQKKELIRLWMGAMGPEATRDALLQHGAMSRKPKTIETPPVNTRSESEAVQPSSTVEYQQDNTRDPPTSDDTKEQEQKNHKLLQQVQDILSRATTPLQEQTAKKLLDLLRGVKDSWQDVQQCCSVIEEKLQLPSIEMLTADHAIAMQLQGSYEGMPANRIAIRTTGDGDCLFHAVGKLLREGREEHTMLLRLGAVVFAVNHQKCIVERLQKELERADENGVAGFLSMISGTQYTDRTELEERLTDAVKEETRKTMNPGEYLGVLPIMFLAGFVKYHILLYCPNPTDSIGYAEYNNVLRTPCSCILDSIPDTLQLEVMLVGTPRRNHFVGLVPTSDDRDVTETDGATNDRATNGSDHDYSDEATGSGPTAKKEDAKATSPPPSQHGEMQQSAGAVEPSTQDEDELTPLIHVDESKAVPDVSDEKEISMNVDSPGQKDNESTPLLSHDQPPQPGTSNSAPQGPDSEVNIRGGVKYLQKGHYNEMNVGGARPKTSPPKKGARSKGQGKDGRRTPQNKGSYKINIEGGVGYMQDGDHNIMNIGPQPLSDNNMDAGSTSVPASTDTLSRVVQEEDCQEIQEHIGLKWKDVAERLSLSGGQIDGIEHDHKEEPLSEKVYQMLRKWKQLKGDSATVAVLIQALEQEGLHDVADRMQIEN